MSNMELRDQRQPGWYWSDNEIVDQFGRQIGAYGIAVYSVLARYAGPSGVCTPSIATIAERVGCSENSVRGAIKKLIEAGLVACEIRSAHAGDYDSNRYVLLKVKKALAGTSPDEGGTSPGEVGTASSEVGVLHHVKGGTSRGEGGTSPREPKEDVNQEVKDSEKKEESARAVQMAADAAPPPEHKAKRRSSPKTDPDQEQILEIHPVYLLAAALAAVCGMDLALNKSRLCKEAKILSGASPPATPELLTRQYGCVDGAAQQSAWWWVSDWRGQKGEWPSPAAIRSTWGQWEKATPQAKGANRNGNGTESGLATIARNDRHSRAPTDAERAEFRRRQAELAERNRLQSGNTG